jgi:hypothetical protein
LNLSLPASVTVQSIQIFSSTGILMGTVTKYEDGIDVSHLHSGFYILNVKTDKGMMTHKFIKE